MAQKVLKVHGVREQTAIKALKERIAKEADAAKAAREKAAAEEKAAKALAAKAAAREVRDNIVKLAQAAYRFFGPTYANQQSAYADVDSAKTVAEAHAIFSQLVTKAKKEKAIKLARQAAAARKAEAARQAANARARAIKLAKEKAAAKAKAVREMIVKMAKAAYHSREFAAN